MEAQKKKFNKSLYPNLILLRRSEVLSSNKKRSCIRVRKICKKVNTKYFFNEKLSLYSYSIKVNYEL
jgi:hypothetical protein